MNGSTGNTASGAYEKPNRREVVLNLSTCRRMLPLIRRIAGDIHNNRRRLEQLQPEQERLDRHRHTLSWPQRSRRYQLREEIAAVEQQLQVAVAELDNLGVVLVDAGPDWVGFPTMVNGRRAFFSWKPGEDDLRFWHFAGEAVRRLIPASWVRADELSVTGKGAKD
jgi:hypothetical protein